MPTADPNEPMIAYEVRELLKNLNDEMRRRFDEQAVMLKDRVTVGVFNSLRSDLDNTIRRLIDAEGEIDKLQEGDRIEAIARESARQALANEAERQRQTLADEAERVRVAAERPVRAWGIRSNKANVVYVSVAVAAVAYGLFRAYLAWRGIGG